MELTVRVPNPILLASRSLRTELPAFVMGIINVTPDSFWENSRAQSVQSAVETALKMESAGAHIIDIGGESTRPGTSYVDEREESLRITPVIEAIRKKTNIAISVDTRKMNVMKAAFEAGADMLNDISALEDNAEMARYASHAKIPVILMHKRGNPDVMQHNTVYADVFNEVQTYLQSRVEFALSRGIAENKIIIDPGIGFGKNLDANRALIKQCGALCGGKYPVLMALSRKTCIGEITGRGVEQRLAGTLAANTLSVLYGASIVRVHDVSETVDCLKTLQSLFP